MLIACRNWISIFRGLRVCVYIYVLLHIFFFFSVLLREVIKKPHVYNARRGELSCFRREISTRTTRIFLFSYYSEEGRWSESFLLNFFFLFFSVNWPTSIGSIERFVYNVSTTATATAALQTGERKKKNNKKSRNPHEYTSYRGGGIYIRNIHTVIYRGGGRGTRIKARPNCTKRNCPQLIAAAAAAVGDSKRSRLLYTT